MLFKYCRRQQYRRHSISPMSPFFSSRKIWNNNRMVLMRVVSGLSYWSPNYKIISAPFAKLPFVETCGPCWQRAKIGRILRNRLQVLAYGSTNSSWFSASGLCHLYGLKKRRHDGCVDVLTGMRPGTADVPGKQHDPSFCSKSTFNYAVSDLPIYLYYI